MVQLVSKSSMLVVFGMGEPRSEGYLPGCDVPYVPKEVKHEEKRPRLRPVNRNQMILHPVDIDNLISEDHEARAIWDLTGSLDLSCYYDGVNAVEGKAGPCLRPPSAREPLGLFLLQRDRFSTE